jgi:Kef-type K+ transport system membrane component KefB
MMMLLVLLIAAGISQQGDWVRWFGLALIVLPVAVLLFMTGQILGVWLGRKIRNL